MKKMTVEDIKSLMKSGDIAGAESAAHELLTADPDNVQAMMLYGTCRQLQGDEATFRDTYVTVKAALDANEVELDTATAEEWKLYEMLHRNLDLPELLRKGDQSHSVLKTEYVVLALLIAVAVGVAVYLFGKGVAEQMNVASQALYGGRPAEALYAGPPADVRDLYAGPRRDNLEKKLFLRTGETCPLCNGTGLTSQKTLCEGCGGQGKGR